MMKEIVLLETNYITSFGEKSMKKEKKDNDKIIFPKGFWTEPRPHLTSKEDPKI